MGILARVLAERAYRANRNKRQHLAFLSQRFLSRCMLCEPVALEESLSYEDVITTAFSDRMLSLSADTRCTAMIADAFAMSDESSVSSWKHECQIVASWYQECLAFHGGTIISGIKGWHVHRALGRYIVAGICDAYVQEWKKNKLPSIRLIVPCEPPTTTLDAF